ncbi:MAG: hypothetical protein Q9M30_09275 [Mariprofundaceae bacterium]|nr:hypothetical protein [Mariprofundaceae bacterium]
MSHQDKAAVSSVGYTWAPSWMRGAMAFVIGIALYKGSMSLLDVHLEYFAGLASFNMAWLIGMSVVPVGVGIVIGMIYGFGGKYLAHFPPVFVMLWTYQHVSAADIPDGAHLLPWGMWIMFVILQAEFCAIGGFIGEIFIRKRFAWDNGVPMTADSEPLPEDEAETGRGPQA